MSLHRVPRDPFLGRNLKMLVPDNVQASITSVQLLTSGLAFLVSIITAILGWIVKGAGERMKKLEERQEHLAERTAKDIHELSERRATSENLMRTSHLDAMGELSERTRLLEIQVARSAEADLNLTKSVDKLSGKVDEILRKIPFTNNARERY
jgi:hypothetical protein